MSLLIERIGIDRSVLSVKVDKIDLEKVAK